MGTVVNVCNKANQPEWRVSGKEDIERVKTNARHARSQRTYNVASIPRSSSILSSEKIMLSLTQESGNPCGAGGEGFLFIY